MTIDMRRRQFIAFLGTTGIALSVATQAQTYGRPKRIGVLMSLPANDIEAPLRVAAFLQRLQELGWTDRRNMQIDFRLAERDTAKSIATDLIAQSPDILLVNGTSGLEAARAATLSIPIVFVNVIDPVGQGFVASLDHPGGNITGLTNIDSEMGGQWVQLLKEIAPQITDVAVIGSNLGGGAGIVAAIRATAQLRGVKFIAANPLIAPSEIEYVFNKFARQPTTGVVVLPGPVTLAHRKQIIALVARNRLPAIYPYRYYVTDGGLMSYGVDLADAYRRAANYVDRILKGEKAADLPIQRATKFELVINMQTAKTLGIQVSPALLEQADEKIV
jgi:putative ABC transport system substrate-binding protein